MKLDNRMSAILSHIDKCKVFADIGCDHGMIAVSVAQNHLADKVIASDISAPSVKKAEMLAIKCGVSNFEVRVGDGTSVLGEDECDTVLVAGMGGRLICDMLSRENRTFNKYIFSPQKDQDYVRKYFREHSLAPICDYKVLSCGKYYDIMVVKAGEYHPSESEILYGSGSGEDFAGFKQHQAQKLENIIAKASGDRRSQAIHYLDLLNKM